MSDWSLAAKEVSSFPPSWPMAKGRIRDYLNCLALLFVLALLGCDRSSMMKKMIPEQDAAVAKHYTEAIRHGEYEALEQDAGPSLAGPELRGMLVNMTTIFPDPTEEPTSLKPVALGFFRKADGATNTSITLEYEFREKWVLAEVVTQKINGKVMLMGIQVRSIPESIETLNGFNFLGKGGSQYTVLLLALMAPLLALYAFVMCIKARLGMSKWLWLAFILVGVGKLAVNWTTGQVFFTPFAVQLVPGGASALGYAPWMVYTSLPIGAIAFLFYQRSKGEYVNAQLGTPNGEQLESVADDTVTKPEIDT
jgi:hypothetical protein